MALSVYPYRDCPRTQKSPFPVEVRRSKTPLIELPIIVAEKLNRGIHFLVC